MSAVDSGTTPAGPAPPRRRISGRFLGSELMLIFGRRRNWAGLAVLAAVPILIGISVRVSAPSGGGEPDFFAGIPTNGLFVALAALTVEIPLFLPLAVSAISGDAVAGEANVGTLRGLLAVPVHRTRLLAVKYAAIAIFALAATMLIAVVGTILGLALFGGGSMILLSGTEVSFWNGGGRVLLACCYIAVNLAALGAVGLFISTLTEQPIGATIATLIFAMASQILGVIQQLEWLHPYLISAHWMAYGDVLRSPITAETIWPGLLLAGAYIAVSLSAAWARFGGRDVSS